jgi:LPXTG-motif cell wall-anchored protein
LGTSQRVLAGVIVVLLAVGIGAVFVKGDDEEPLTLPTTSPTPSETFTFPGPVPTESETPLFPTATETETAAGPEVSPGEELPRTGGGSLLWPAALTLALAAGGGMLVRRTARSVS